jgi:hypothetical protein
MGPPSYMRTVVDRNVVMRRIPVYLKNLSENLIRITGTLHEDLCTFIITSR